MRADVDRGGQPRVRHGPPDGVAVRRAGDVADGGPAGEDGLAAEHRGTAVVDGEAAEHAFGRALCGDVLERLLPDESGLADPDRAHRELEAGHGRRVLGRHVGAPGAVALFEAQRLEGLEKGRDHPVRKPTVQRRRQD